MRLHTCRNCDMLLLPEDDDDLFSLLLEEDDATVAPVMIRDEYGEEYGEDDEGEDDREEFKFNADDDEEVKF